MSLDEII